MGKFRGRVGVNCKSAQVQVQVQVRGWVIGEKSSVGDPCMSTSNGPRFREVCYDDG